MARGGAWQHLTAGAIALCGTAAFATDDQLDVPSGQPVTFQEMIWDQPGGGLTYRFRFVAPEIGAEGRKYEDVEIDMHHLCQTYAIPRLAQTGPQPSQIVISFSQQATEFGIPDPDITQFFEAYRIENGACILEFF